MKFFLVFCFVATLQAWANLNDDYQNFLKNPNLTLTAQEIRTAKKYHFVLVAGFINEIYPSKYFLETEKSLKKMGIKVTRLFPSSLKTIQENSDWLNDQLENAYKQGDEAPLIVLGHSKGGAETLYTHLEHPRLLSEKIVIKIITLQSPLGGNALFEAIPFSRPLTALSPFYQIRALAPELLKKMLRDKFKVLKMNSPRDFRRMVKATNYIVSNKKVEDINSAIRTFGRIIYNKGQTPNDGLVATKDMSLEGYGNIMGLIHEVDHLDLVAEITIPTVAKQIAFTKTFIRYAVKNP